MGLGLDVVIKNKLEIDDPALMLVTIIPFIRKNNTDARNFDMQL